MYSRNNRRIRECEETGELLVRGFGGRWYAWEPDEEEAIDIRKAEYRRLGVRGRALERRRYKGKYTRRRGNVEWARRQRREDRNAQVIH
jgi:hypothetical protein